MSIFYNSSSLPSYKTLVEHDYQTELFHFRKSAAKHLYVFEPSPMWGVSAKTKPTHFSKENILLVPHDHREGDKASTFQIIKRKDAFESFTWHTTVKKLKEAKRWGIVHTSSLTGGVVATLGHYRVIVHERMGEGFISNRFKEKMWLLDLFQDRFEALEQLECLVNQNLAYGESKLAAIDKIKKGLIAYIQQLRAIQDKNELNNLASIDEDIERAEVYLNELNEDNLADYNQATGVTSILEFVKRQMVHNLEEMQGINQSLTYSTDKQFAGTRGDLNSCIIDAQKFIEDYEADSHNATIDGHHGNFGDDNEMVAYNSTQHKLTPTQEQQACLAISFIERMNVLHLPEDDNHPADHADKKLPYIKNGHGKFNLKIVAASKWHTNHVTAALVRLVANFTVRIVAGFLDLAVVIVTFPLKSFGVIKAIRKTTHLWATTDFNMSERERAEDKTKRGDLPVLAGYEEREKTHRRLSSLASKAGSIILNIFDNIIVDAYYGVQDVVRQFTVKFFHTVLDYHADGDKRQNFDEVMSSVDLEIDDIKEKRAERFASLKQKLHLNIPAEAPDQALLHKIIDRMEDEEIDSPEQEIVRVEEEMEVEPNLLHEKAEIKEKAEAEVEVEEKEHKVAMPQKRPERHDIYYLAKRYAATEYDLTGVEMNDLLSAAARGGKKFASIYIHYICAQHKMAAVMFAALYAAGSLSVLMPSMMSHVVPAKFINFSQALGSATASGKVSSAIAAGANEAQLAAAIWEFMLHGPKSWLVTGLNELAADPATTIIYASAAVLLGYAVAFEFDIPGLSEEIRSNIGSVPPVALGASGIKIGILLVEFMHAKVKEDLDQMDLTIHKLHKFIEKLYRKSHPEIKDKAAIEVHVQGIMEKLLKANNLEAMQKIYDHAEEDIRILELPDVREKIDDKIKRFRITSFIEMNRENVSYLSPRKKHDLMRQIKTCFTPEQAASLKKTLYPEDKRSILRTTLSVVFGFALDSVLLAIASVSSVLQGNLRPFNSAYADSAKRANDLQTRIKHAVSQVVQVGLTVVMRLFIITVLDILVNSVAARLFTWATNSNWVTRTSYQFSAMASSFYTDMRQRLASWSGLNDSLKDFSAPHPADTRNKVAASYLTMFKKLVSHPVAPVADEHQIVPLAHEHAIFPLRHEHQVVSLGHKHQFFPLEHEHHKEAHQEPKANLVIEPPTCHRGLN